MDSIQSFYNTVRRMTKPIILRKIEMLFYVVYIALCLTGFILPFALDVNKAVSYTVGVLALIYAIVLHLFRFEIKVSFGLVIHTAIFFFLSSFIIFDFGIIDIGIAFTVIGVLCLSFAVILYGLGHRVFANSVNEPPINPGWPEVAYGPDGVEQVEQQIIPNPLHFNNDENSPEMPNVVNPEVLNNDVADPQIQENDRNPEVLNNDAADPQMQENDRNPEVLNNDAADPQMQENDRNPDNQED